jgi:hypothetical protein
LTPEEIAQLQARYAQKASSDLDAIVEIGRTNHGAQNFDEAADVVVKELGQERADVLRQALPNFNVPTEIITHLADNETRLKALAKMSPNQLVVELARIEAERGPRTAHGVDAAWKDQAKNKGRVSDERWRSTGGAELDDKSWHREFDRRQAERSRRVR